MQKYIAASLAALSLAGSSLACNVVSGVKFTAYGFPDAPGTPAFMCQGTTVVPSQAGDQTPLGDGSFANPYTAASATGSPFAECELLYHPLLKKYFRINDNCSGCVALQTDLYIVQADSDIGQTGCEQAFGDFEIGQALHEVIQDPPADLEVDTDPLFADGQCFNDPSLGRVFPDNDGQVQCGSSKRGLHARAFSA